MDYELKDNKTYRINLGLPKSSRVINNQNMTRALALEFIRINPEPRKRLFSKLPANIDTLLNPKKKSK